MCKLFDYFFFGVILFSFFWIISLIFEDRFWGLFWGFKDILGILVSFWRIGGVGWVVNRSFNFDLVFCFFLVL